HCRQGGQGAVAAGVEAGTRRSGGDRRCGLPVGKASVDAQPLSFHPPVRMLRREEALRLTLILLAALLALPVLPLRAEPVESFADFIRNFETKAVQAGISRETYRAAM